MVFELTEENVVAEPAQVLAAPVTQARGGPGGETTVRRRLRRGPRAEEKEGGRERMESPRPTPRFLLAEEARVRFRVTECPKHQDLEGGPFFDSDAALGVEGVK